MKREMKVRMKLRRDDDKGIKTRFVRQDCIPEGVRLGV